MSGALDLPDIITMAEIAQALGWSTERARRWLKRHGAARKAGVGRNGQYVTTPAKLREAFPEAWDAIARARLE